MKELRIRHFAQSDFDQAIDYYETHAPHVIDQFIAEFRAGLRDIQKAPLTYPKKFNHVRVKFLKMFPFGIHFLEHNDCIHIIAILHTSRNPIEVKQRSI